METRQKLEYYRKKRNLTQADVAARLAQFDIYVDRSSVSHWESGNEPSFAVFCALAKIYDVDINDFRPGRIFEEKSNASDGFVENGQIDLDKALAAFDEEWKEKERKTIATKVDNLDCTFCDKGVYSISSEMISNIVDGCLINYQDHHIIFVIKKLKELGYAILYVFNDNVGISIDLFLPGGKECGYKFRNDLIDILVGLADKDYCVDEKEDLFKDSKEYLSQYLNSIDKKAAEILKYKYDFTLEGGETEIDGCYETKEDLFAVIESVKPELIGDNTHLPGAVSWNNYEIFKKAYSQNELINYHIYWLDKEGEEYKDYEEDFAYDVLDLIEKLKTKKRAYFEIKYNGENEILEKLDGRLYPTDKLDLLVKLFKQGL